MNETYFCKVLVTKSLVISKGCNVSRFDNSIGDTKMATGRNIFAGAVPCQRSYRKGKVYLYIRNHIFI